MLAGAAVRVIVLASDTPLPRCSSAAAQGHAAAARRRARRDGHHTVGNRGPAGEAAVARQGERAGRGLRERAAAGEIGRDPSCGDGKARGGERAADDLTAGECDGAGRVAHAAEIEAATGDRDAARISQPPVGSEQQSAGIDRGAAGIGGSGIEGECAGPCW